MSLAPGFLPRLHLALRRVAGFDRSGWKTGAGRRLGVEHPHVSLWLNGRRTPNAANLAAIARASGVSLDWLVLDAGPVARPDVAAAPAESAP